MGEASDAVDVNVRAAALEVIRASPSSFRVAWTERRYVDGALVATERWTAILGVTIQSPRTPEQLRRNPLGVFVNSLDWSRELG
nr:VirB8/TrbF family protein [Phenylobacterium sp.]